MDKELKAEIRNKLTTAQTALDLLAKEKNIPQKFIEKALEDLKQIDKLLSKEN